SAAGTTLTARSSAAPASRENAMPVGRRRGATTLASGQPGYSGWSRATVRPTPPSAGSMGSRATPSISPNQRS
ncbi:MAG: hypothetical protein K8I02_11890, partial [Candidatus Methylomirabilis sp.]|nr:hypothetical protein [Deltaproteobacteria bacterium]